MTRTVMDTTNKLLKPLLYVYVALMLGLAIFGTIAHFSHVPRWDMWMATTGFAFDIQEGKYSEWWVQHNEHRIILSRLLFWLDTALFDSTGVSLQVENFLLVFACCGVFWLYIKRTATKADLDSGRAKLLLLFLAGWLFFWSQDENFTWGFQSQFFLAQLVPLATFYCLAVAASTQSKAHFIGACVLGIASAGTMANGVLALPLAFVMSCFLPISKSKRLILLALSVIVGTLYFHGFKTPQGNGSIAESLMTNPLGMAHYTMAYLGAPAKFLLHKLPWSVPIALTAGYLFTFLSLVAAILCLVRRPPNAYILGLLTFIVYAAGSGFGAAGGRMKGGLSQALSERYTTSTVIAWAALIIIWMALARQKDRKRTALPLVFGSIFCVLALSFQVKALQPNHQLNFIKQAGAFSLVMKAPDWSIADVLFPIRDYVQTQNERFRERSTGYIVRYPYDNMYESLGTQVTSIQTQSVCRGNLDSVQPVDDVHDFMRIGGWVFDAEKHRKSQPERLRVVDRATNKIVGYLLTGEPRKDVVEQVSKQAELSGFVGYIQSTAAGSALIALTDDASCGLPFVLPKLQYRSFAAPVQLTTENLPSVVSRSSVIDFQNFEGGNLKDSTPVGLKVFSSYVSGDQDTGSISLRVRNGDRVLFTTGPVGGAYFLETSLSTAALPLRPRWTVLEFVGLPDDPRGSVVRFEDRGAAWGQWMAVGVLDK